MNICAVLAAPRIRGRLTDASNGQPIGGADVLLFVTGSSQPKARALPDESGAFEFADVPDGDYTLMVRLIGYDVYSSTAFHLSGKDAHDMGTIRLKPLEIGLAEVEVRAQKKQLVYKLDKKVIEANNLQADGGSAVDILENTPSIRVDAEGELTFRGSSGFAVYVDGKPSIFSGTQALEQIPASRIAQIEIITTPSARHDSEGDAGIINIITKKHQQNGFSGIANLSGNTVGSHGLDFLLSQQRSVARWYVGGDWRERMRKSHFDQTKWTKVGSEETESASKGPRTGSNYNYSLKAGWMATLPKTTYNVDLEGGYGGRARSGNLDYRETHTGAGGTTNNDYNSRDEYDVHETFLQGIVGFDHSFDKKEHHLAGSFLLKYGGDALEYFQSDLFDQSGIRQQGHRAYEDEIRWTMRANLDYIWPYNSTGRLEAGYQYFSYLEDGDYSMQFWDPAISDFYWSDDIYNTFYFQRGINSLYSIWADRYKDFDFQIGVRAEHTHRVLESSKAWANRTVNRLEFFPSAHLGYVFGKNHVLASWSRRTNRPQLFYMEPYITYRDYYSAEIGNPDIRPEYIDAFELNYKRDVGEHTLSASLFSRTRTDKIERLRVPFEAGVTLDSMVNVGHDYSNGLELSGQFIVIKRWSLNANGSLYHYRVVNEFSTGDNESSINYGLSLNNTFELAKYTRLQLDGNWVGPSVTTQGQTDAFWYANLALRQQFAQRKFTATLSFRNVFGSARWTTDIIRSDLRSSTRIRPYYPTLAMTLSYNFNNFKSKASEQTPDHDIFEGTNH